mgnify:CR=1 FL=1
MPQAQVCQLGASLEARNVVVFRNFTDQWIWVGGYGEDDYNVVESSGSPGTLMEMVEAADAWLNNVECAK